MNEPTKSDLLIFEKDYHCWLDHEYIGIATYTDDPNIGPAFITMSVSSDGELIHEVLIPDIYKLK